MNRVKNLRKRRIRKDEPMDKRDQNERKKILEYKIIQGAATETVQRYGSAVKEHLVSYSGIDNETGQQLTKSLKSISKSKVNPKCYNQNIKQQAGFSAEVKSTARNNAKNIINKSSKRSIRTDDMGRVNDPLYDHVDLDVQGNIIKGSGSQMKFVGSTPDELLTKLNSKKFQKYIDADCLLSISDGDYDALMGVNGKQGIIDQKINSLNKQKDKAEKLGKSDIVAEKKTKIEKYKKIKKNIRKSGLTKKEAVEARLHPKISVAKDVAKVAHEAGIDQAKYGVVISGSISLIKNFVALVKGEKEIEEAATSIARDTGVGTALSYSTAFSGTVIKGAMQSSASGYVAQLSKTNLASGLVTTTLDIGRTIHRYFQGEVNSLECIEELGEKGVGEIGSAMFASMSFNSIKGVAKKEISKSMVAVAGMTGATFGYIVATAVYQELANALKERDLAKEERIRVEAECKEAIHLIKQYRREMNEMVSQYLTERIQIFEDGFRAMDEAIMNNDVDGFIKGNADIQAVLGKKIQFATQEEFDALMLSDIALKL